MNKERLIIGLVFLVFYTLSASGVYFFLAKNASSETTYVSPVSLSPEKIGESQITVENEGPKTEPCPLNGKLYTKKQKERWEKRRPLGIMVENHKEARPQSGLQNADVVFEAVAEGGITRFLAVYLCEDANPVGPVRSARVYFIRLLQGFGDYPLYAHVGGANTPGPADALGLIRKLGWSRYNDLNQFSVPYPYFWRDYERLKGRAVEHTVYTSTTKLWQYAAEKRNLTDVDKKGNRWDKNFQAWKFKERKTTGKIKTIEFGFWSNKPTDPYFVKWEFDEKTKLYNRFNGGEPLKDKNTGKPLRFKNIVIMFAKESPANDGYPGGHLLYTLKGSGRSLIFFDGQAINGIWKRPSYKDQIRFYDTTGEEIIFSRGKIFVEILPIGNKVNYK